MARRHDNLLLKPTTQGADAASESALYLEYVEGLLDVPTLTLHDEVVVSPRPTLPVDFRSGQRADARKAPRDDLYRLREELASDLEVLYAEYASRVDDAEKKKGKSARTAATRASVRKRGKGGRKGRGKR
ncbi:MAG TPA: hypothetical protein VMU03_15800 [Gammaproteobacteria bacterium]|jgi:hypothetical protein|nr:hypothetical protein [Gammaproteobacteria bacterium]